MFDVRQLIRVKLYSRFLYSFVQKPFSNNFSLLFLEKIILNFLLNLSDQKSDFKVTLDYLTPALNNLAHIRILIHQCCFLYTGKQDTKRN